MIKSNVSKAQIEVWEWKESLYEEIKNIPDNKKLDFIHKKTANTIERIKKSFKKTELENDVK